MRKLLFAVSMLLLANVSFGYVFINSVPMKSAVYLDGTYIGVSPLVVRDELQGSHQIRFVKTGYFDSDIKVNIENSVTNIYTFLTPRAFSLYIPNQMSVQFDNHWYTNDTIRNLPDGFYRFDSGTDYISIKREYPRKAYFWVSVAATGIGLLNGIVGSINADDNYNQFLTADNAEDAISDMNRAMFWDNYSSIGYFLSAVGGTCTVVLAVDFAKFNAQNVHVEIDSAPNAASDVALYNKAMDYFTSGDMNDAATYFSKIIKDFNESKYTPISLFRRAGIYQSQNRYGEAIADLEMIKTVYPIYELYAFTLKTLGDLYYAQGAFTDAVSNYQETLLLTPSAGSEMNYWIVKCYVGQYKLSGDPALRTKIAKLIADYTASADNPENYKKELRELNY